MTGVEFEAWETPFEDGHLTIIETRHGNGGIVIQDEVERIAFELPSVSGRGESDLLVRLFWHETRSVYRMLFEGVSAFRVLDEHGLTEVWEATGIQGGRPAHATFKLRGHGWTKESPATFQCSHGWSFVVATDWECVEVVCDKPPTVEFEQKVEEKPLTD